MGRLLDHVRSFEVSCRTTNAISPISIGFVRGVRDVGGLKLKTCNTPCVSKSGGGIVPYFCLIFFIRGFNFPAHRNLRVSEGVENLLG